MNSFTVGRDVVLNIATSYGPLHLLLTTSFQSKQDIQEKKIKGLDGVTRHVRFFDGWSGTFEVERQNSNVDDYFAQLEADYYSGLPEQPALITETITERNGATTQYRYEGVYLKLDDAGKFAGDETVPQKISFVSRQRRKIA